jgi:hypothetical protein
MLFAASALLALLPFVAAQTSTLCDPTKKSCPADPGFDQATTVYDFQKSGLDDTWDVLGSGDKISQDSNGLHFTIDGPGEAPTLATKSTFYSKKVANLRRIPLFRTSHCYP